MEFIRKKILQAVKFETVDHVTQIVPDLDALYNLKISLTSLGFKYEPRTYPYYYDYYGFAEVFSGIGEELLINIDYI